MTKSTGQTARKALRILRVAMASKSNSISNHPKVLVVDDEADWVKILVAQFKRESIDAEGVSDPAKIFAWTDAEKFGRFDIIFLDMRLGMSKANMPVSAADLLLHILTYCPTARVVVFTQKEITVEECVRCIQFGALGFIPKLSSIDHFVLVANVYRRLATERQVYEERLHSLWDELMNPNNPVKGRHLEMLTTNLFNSIEGFRVIRNNSTIISGEVDLIVQNPNLSNHPFWREINSYHIVVECKNLADASEKEVFSVLRQKVEDKRGCNAGILVSWSGVSKGFRDMQSALSGQTRIFFLNGDHLSSLVNRPAADREDYLRDVLESQF